MSHNIDTTNVMQYNRGVEQIKFRRMSHNINTINITITMGLSNT
jgi:hypothetical protein